LLDFKVSGNPLNAEPIRRSEVKPTLGKQRERAHLLASSWNTLKYQTMLIIATVNSTARFKEKPTFAALVLLA
jgi:hypothetical protein